ncbi:MAG: 50S ribosomal protein L10 [bacterium]|nr:50S ribosomal protein L10 [bacterium]
MALTKDKKNQVVAEVSKLLSESRLTVIAQYQGTTVKAIQSLRKEAKNNDTKVSVIKNRLVIKALESIDTFKDIDRSQLTGQLLYAFNDRDEVAPAQVLNTFAKTNPNLQFVGAITAEGKFMSAEDVRVLAILPGKNDLIAHVIATLQSPLNDVLSGLSGNLHGLLDGIEAKAN